MILFKDLVGLISLVNCYESKLIEKENIIIKLNMINTSYYHEAS